MLSDAPALQSFIDNILRHGLDIKLEKQILAGDGTNGNMLGLIPQATAYAPPAGAPATPNMFDVLRFAMLQLYWPMTLQTAMYSTQLTGR
ncbi:hypothetical protein BANRA_02509 [Acinetobacter baumannii]|nr:hypothetical protein BANRA_02509 [Acinetobacter baumannii]